MSLAFSVKMDESQIALYKKQQRRQNRSKVRQAVFINEYVFYKHFDICQDAAQLYNQINLLYPRKPDLRRTEEFRVWRNNVTGQPNIRMKRKPTVKRQPYVFPAHANIPVAEYIDPNASFVVADQPESPQPESPQPESPQPESPQPESPQPESPQPESPQPESPQPESPQQESPQPESPQPESPQPESPQPESPQPESPVHSIKGGKVMELRIPLMNPPAETRPLVTQEVLQKDNLEPAVYTETLETVTEEVLQEDTIEPSLYEEISPEIIEKIIEELRQDPGLKDIITSVEEQLELQQVGMDIDISDDDRLEAELENMILW